MREARRKSGRSEDREGEFITSLARGLSVLRAFSKEHPEMTLSQVASATQLSAATARRCLHTLVDLGYAAKRGKLFLLRPAVVAFASAYIESMNLEQIVRPYLQDVRDKTGDSSSLAVLAETDILYPCTCRRTAWFAYPAPSEHASRPTPLRSAGRCSPSWTRRRWRTTSAKCA
jgi:hypothetical protein